MKNNIGFICPVCKKPLVKNEKSYICENGHNFDIAKSGYVNLLTGSSRKNHGDNRLMTDSRREFLSKGYYEPLRRALCDTVQKYAAQKGNVFDCGCGEGYYTKAVADVLPLSSVFGTDISKDELTVAAKRAKNVDFAVASSFSLPFADSSIDILLEIFSPYCRIFPHRYVFRYRAPRQQKVKYPLFFRLFFLRRQSVRKKHAP